MRHGFVNRIAPRARLLETAHELAARIVADAEKILLRSAALNAPARVEFVRIAEAVGSNKLLLRS